jgi:hypothetical protein
MARRANCAADRCTIALAQSLVLGDSVEPFDPDEGLDKLGVGGSLAQAIRGFEHVQARDAIELELGRVSCLPAAHTMGKAMSE